MEGLTHAKASELLQTYGENVLIEKKKTSVLRQFIAQIYNPLIILLIGAAAVSFFIGEGLDASLIVSIVVLNALFGLYQEHKAETSLAALKKMTITKVRIIRDGKEKEIESKYIVPGDVMYVEEGTKVCADGMVINAINLSLNESVLTGESMPVVKQKKEPVFSGTIVLRGRGHVIVTETGMHTRFGAIAQGLADVKQEQTPLQKKLTSTSRIIGSIGLSFAAIVFLFSIVRGETYINSFLLAISLAVAVVPEGLPAVMTITLALGMAEMAKRKSIVRKLSAIEALGSITVIATDKTGTLTTNQTQVRELFIRHLLHTDQNLPEKTSHPFDLLLINGILCSTASLVPVHNHGAWEVLGDPTEGALLYLAQKSGLDIDTVRQSWQIINEEEFDSTTKKMSVLARPSGRASIPNNPSIQNHPSVPYIFTKGAPETIIPLCSHYMDSNGIEPMTEQHKKTLQEQMTQWAKRGLRVLAFAYKQEHESTTVIDTHAMTFLGMVTMHDAPRKEAVDAVRKAHDAGIRVIMVTGDNPITAEAIGLETGIVGRGSEIVTGAQLDTYTDEQLLRLLPHVSIFARTSPQQKHRIVQLLQKQGEIVAVTGDGVNDAIALKQANVGIAMGMTGTDVARETADMVITDDNFASIVQAIDEGRNIIKHLKNAITNLLACNMSEALTILVGLIAGVPHFLYPLQLLYINLVTDGLPALAIPFAPRDGQLMREKSQKSFTLLGKREIQYIVSIGIIATILIFIAYFIFSPVSSMLGKTAAFSVLTLIQSFIFVNVWLDFRPVIKHIHGLFSPIFLVAFSVPFITQLLIVGSGGMAMFFHVVTVSLPVFLVFVVLSAGVLLCTELLFLTRILKK